MIPIDLYWTINHLADIFMIEQSNWWKLWRCFSDHWIQQASLSAILLQRPWPLTPTNNNLPKAAIPADLDFSYIIYKIIYSKYWHWQLWLFINKQVSTISYHCHLMWSAWLFLYYLCHYGSNLISMELDNGWNHSPHEQIQKSIYTAIQITIVFCHFTNPFSSFDK